MSNQFMLRRPAVVLSLLHLLVIMPLIVHQDTLDWDFYVREERRELWQHSHPQPPAVNTGERVSWDPITIDYWPPLRVNVVNVTELPAALLVGWSHLMSPFYHSPLHSALAKTGVFVPIRLRVVSADAVLVVAVFLQWTFIGWALQCRKGSRRLWNLFAWGITAVGAAAALLSEIGRSVETFGTSLSRALLLAWILGAISLLFTLARKISRAALRQRSPAMLP